ncbi:uncharacterized protein LOC141905166 isoform X2 [Tubulanus polymorphus]|uniref:uncharacterized protein LOC141905166 isoform X2 n=1 Tax=Tubulanus polymorphus TaxID=672921 RepID=UPI003DA53093
MSIIQVTGSGGKSISDRTLFTGSRIPTEIKSMVKCLKTVKKPTFIKLLQIAVSDLEGKEIGVTDFQHEVLTESLNEELVRILYSGLYSLLVLALRIPITSLKQQTFNEDLQELKIPEEFIPLISSAVFGSKRAVLDEKVCDSRPRLPRLDSLNWRVDVAISTSSLNRVLEPSVAMEMTLSDGNIHNFEQQQINPAAGLMDITTHGAERGLTGEEKEIADQSSGGLTGVAGGSTGHTSGAADVDTVGGMTVNLVDVTVNEQLKDLPPPGGSDRQLDRNLVQVQANKQEIDRRINSFIQRKRLEVDELNRREFCGQFIEREMSGESTTNCARTDARFHPSATGNSHVKVWRVVNPWGPQTRISATGNNTNKRDTSITSTALNERLDNLEKHLKISPPIGPENSKDVYARIRGLEDRVLYLESLSPEYFNEKPLKKYRGASHLKKQPIEPYRSDSQSESSMSVFEIDQRIKSLQESLRQKNSKKS